MFGRIILGFDGTAQGSDALALAKLLATPTAVRRAHTGSEPGMIRE